MTVNNEGILAHDIIREGLAKIRGDRGKAVEFDLIKRRLGLDDSATFQDVCEVIDAMLAALFPEDQAGT